ncbi:MAG: thioredoxin domain-containing protein [Myxococcota bacterium]
MTDEEKKERDDVDAEGETGSDDYDDETEGKPSYAVADDEPGDADKEVAEDDADDEEGSAEENAGASDDDDDAAAAAKEEAPATATKKKKKRRKKKTAAKAAAAAAAAAAVEEEKEDADPRDRAAPPPNKSGSTALVAGIAAGVLGLGGGFLVGKNQGDKSVKATQDPAAAIAVASATGTDGKSGPCQAYADALCEKLGATSPVCKQAKGASSFLSDKTCTVGLSDIGATVEKLKAARGDCDKLVTDLCNALGQESESCQMVTKKTPEFPAAQCSKMLENYDQVLKQLQTQELKNKPLSAEMAAKQAGGDDVPSFGPADAKVTIVEYSDFECPYCARAAKTVNDLKKAYPEGVRFVFRQYPLPMHKNAQLAAEASLAAHAQGKFWAMHDQLFEKSRSLSRETIEAIAKDIGLDMKKFKAALDDGTFKDAVKRDMDLGGEIGVSGTPTMIVGTKRVRNPGDIKGIQKLVEEEGGPKAKEVPAEEKKDGDGDKPKKKAPIVRPVPVAPGGAPKAPGGAAAPPSPPAGAPKAPAPATP